MRSEDIRAALSKKFCAPEYALFFEVGDATGGRARRWADAVAMGLWPSRGLSLSGFEIKVSRQDWVKEMRQPAKAEAIAQYCSQWWMVTAPGLIKDGELPELWGHFELHPNGLRVIKPAPITEAVPISREFLAALLRRASELDRKIERETIEKAIARDEDTTKQRIENEVEFRVRRAEEKAKDAHEKLQAIYDACGLEPHEVSRMFGGDNFARAVGMVHRLGVAQTYGGLADLAKKVRPLADSIDTFMAAISDNEAAA